MTRWCSRLIQKCLASVIKHPRKDVARLKHKKYAVVGLSGGLAALTFGNVNNDDTIVVGARGFLRFFRSIKVGLSISLDYYFAMLGLTEGTPNYDVMMSRIHQRCAERIRDGCLQNGGTYVKIGQGLVSLSHILPREYIDTLKILQDTCLARDKEELYQVFIEDFGKKPEEIYKTFDINPIAAASIAQVFKATTLDGQEVAVKVQYNDLQKRLDSDIMTIKILLTFGKWLHPKVDFTWIFDDFVGALRQELDFVNEGLNGERCSKDLSHLKYIHVPTVLWNYTNKRVLVTEYIKGIKISDQRRLKEEGFSLVDINNKLFEAFGHQIFQTGFVHADPHPGNILLRKRNGKAELVILDHGLYQKVTNEERLALSHMWKAIVFGNHEQMQKYSKILGVDDYMMFAEILTQAPLRTLGFKLKVKLSKEEEKYMKQAAGEKFDQIVLCLQQMPRKLLFVVRNLNTIRAISYDHGCPIDRYAVLARMATKSTFDFTSLSVTKRVVTTFSKIWFEVILLISRFVSYWRMVFLDVLFKFGVTPDINALMEQTARHL